MSLTMKCNTCHYYDKQIDKNDVTANMGVCQRYPPTAQVIQTAQGSGTAVIRPTVGGDSVGCGEHVPTLLSS